MDLPCSGAESGHIYHRYVSRNKGGKNEFPAILARLGFLARTNARMGGVSLLSFTTQTICMKPKVIRISTVPLSLHLLLQGQLKMLAETYEVLAVSSSGEELHKVAEREASMYSYVRLSIRSMYSYVRLSIDRCTATYV